MKVLLYWVVLAVFVVSCKETQPIVSEKISDYYPIKTGDSAIYRVEKKIYNEILPDSLWRYYLKEVVGKSFQDQPNSFELLRYSGETERGPWRLDSIWAVRVEPNRMVRIENGLPLVVLSEPIGKSWDANFYNTKGYDVFVYFPLNLKDLICVSAADNQKNLLLKRNRKACFEKGKGMTLSETEFYFYVNDSENPAFGLDSISTGFSIFLERIF
jgi:hypothetical protein